MKKVLSWIIGILVTAFVITYVVIIPLLGFIDSKIDCSEKNGTIIYLLKNIDLLKEIDILHFIGMAIFNLTYGFWFFSIVIFGLMIPFSIINLIFNIILKNKFHLKDYLKIVFINAVPFLFVSNTSYSYLYYKNEYCQGDVTNALTGQNVFINTILCFVLFVLCNIINQIFVLKNKKSFYLHLIGIEILISIIINMILPWTFLD